MKIVKLPEKFFLKGEYLNQSIECLNILVNCRDKKVALDFSEIDQSTKGDIMILLAQIEKSILVKGKTLYRFGKLPKNKKIKELLKEATGINHYNETLTISDLPDSDKEKYIDVDFIDSIVTDLKKIGIKQYYYPFNSFLTELVANAVEHGIKMKNINWWFSLDYDNKTRTRKYTFVDMGKGIAKSHRESGLPWKYFFSKDKRIVIDSLLGVLVSSTKEENRGKGLPQLYKMAQDGLISDMVVITNRVSLYFENGSLITENNVNFEGTYFSWSINFQNYQTWKKLE